MLKSALLQLAQHYSPNELKQGQIYYQHGHVLTIRLSDGLLRGRVKGTQGQIYDVHVDLRFWPQQPSRCSCSIQQDCHHAVAFFISQQAK